MRQVRKNYDKWLAKAVVLRHWVCEEFAWDNKHKFLIDSVLGFDSSLIEKNVEKDELVLEFD
jgi:hypothetical protein